MSQFAVKYDADRDLGNIALVTGDPGDALVDQSIQFQHGPIADNGINGVQNEEVLKLLTIRLRELNARFPCRENSLAITHIEEALHWLEARTAARREQNVEGKNLAHVS